MGYLGYASSVDFSTADGTALARSDYTANAGTITFNPNEATKTITVSIINDTAFEGPEAFAIRLSNSTNATIGNGQASGTINPNDRAPALTGTRATLASGTEDTPYVINLADLVVGWTDADGDRLNSNNWYVDHGSVSFSGYDGNGNGTITIVPEANYERACNTQLPRAGWNRERSYFDRPDYRGGE